MQRLCLALAKHHLHWPLTGYEHILTSFRLQFGSLHLSLVVFDDMLRSNTRRGRAPADNSDVLAMFRLVYGGEGATQPLVDDFS